MNSKKVIQSLENSFSAANLGTNKYLINVNGGDARVPTNENSRILYNLQDPIKLEKGDKITLYKAFLNERGLTDSTITFDTEMTQEIRFLYYKLGDCEDYAEGSDDVSYCPFPKFFPDAFSGGGTAAINGNTSVFVPNFLQPIALTGLASNVTIRNNGYLANPLTLDWRRVAGDDLGLNMPPTADMTNSSNRSSGSNGKMFYLMEGCRLLHDPNETAGSSFTYGKFWNQSWNSDASNPQVDYNDPVKLCIKGEVPLMRPVYGKAKIVVPKGNYGVDALSEIIMNQLNGSIGEAGTATQKQSDALCDKLYHPNISKIGATSNTLPFFDNIVGNRVDTDADITIHDNLFYKSTSQRKNGGIMCELNLPKTAFYESITVDNLTDAALTIKGNPNNSASTSGAPFNANFWINNPHNGWTAAHQPTGSQGGMLVNMAWDEHYRTTGGGSFRDQCGAVYGKTPGLFFYSGTELEYEETGGNRMVGFDAERSLLAENNNYYISNGFLDTWVKRAGEGNIIDMHLRTSGRYKPDGTLRLFENDEGTKGLVGSEPPPTSTDPSQASSVNDNVYQILEDNMYLRMLFPVYGRNKTQMIRNPTDGSAYDPNLAHTAYCGVPANGDFRKIYGGTSDFSLVYDSKNADRFSLSNFHDFFKCPSYDSGGNSTGMGGNQSTKYNNPYGQTRHFAYPSRGLPFDKAANPVNWASDTSAVYPIDAQTGIMINNFAYDVCKDTQVYKDLKAKILAQQTFWTGAGDHTEDGADYGKNAMLREKDIFDLFTKPFDQFFPTPLAAQQAWETTLWARLGFTYDQLGDITSQLESRMTGGSPLNDRSLPLYGIVTHNQFDYTSIASSGGLGSQHWVPPANADAHPKQKYTLESYFLGKCATGQVDQNIGQPFLLLESSKAIAATNLPNLSGGKNYYIIESDIVKPNYENSIGTRGTIVGIMTKENSTADTLFNTDGIEFIITEDKLLTEINIDIKNPDGTRVPDEILGVDNGFIFLVEKPIPVEEMQTNSF